MGVLNGEFYAQRLQKVIYLHLFIDYVMKISLQLSEQICSDDWREIFMKQSVNKCR